MTIMKSIMVEQFCINLSSSHWCNIIMIQFNLETTEPSPITEIFVLVLAYEGNPSLVTEFIQKFTEADHMAILDADYSIFSY